MNKNMKQKTELIMVKVLQYTIAIVLGLVVGAAVMMTTGNNPINVYMEMFQKSFIQLYYLLQTITRATPIVFSALAVIVTWRAGFINLGVEGQMILGALAATLIAIYLPGPPILVLIIAIAGGMAVGAMYALIAAFLFRKFNVPMVICTLMMNYIASYFSSYLVTYPFKDKAGDGLALQTVAISKGLKFPTLVQNTTFNFGFIILIIVVLIVVFLIKKTKFGYESKITGLNKEFARYGGIDNKKLLYQTMALSGALAALGGICEIFGVKSRYADGMFTSASYAWSGLMAALISNLNPIGSFFSGIFLSTLQVGGQSIQRTLGIPLQLATIIQSSITLFISVKLFGKYFDNLRSKTLIKYRTKETVKGD